MSKKYKICIIGLGYVGLPLAIYLSKHFKVIGFDKDNSRILQLKKGFDLTGEINKKTIKNSKILFTSNEKNIGINNDTSKKQKEIKINNFKYIIKIADLFFEDSAIMLKKRLINEFNFKNVYIEKITKNSFRVYKGPFENLESIKKEYNDISKLNFENIEIIKL